MSEQAVDSYNYITFYYDVCQFKSFSLYVRIFIRDISIGNDKYMFSSDKYMHNISSTIL